MKKIMCIFLLVTLCGCDNNDKAIRKEAAYRIHEFCLNEMSDARLCQCIHDELMKSKNLFSVDVARDFLLMRNTDRCGTVVSVATLKCQCRFNPHLDEIDGVPCREIKRIRTQEQLVKVIEQWG